MPDLGLVADRDRWVLGCGRRSTFRGRAAAHGLDIRQGTERFAGPTCSMSTANPAGGRLPGRQRRGALKEMPTGIMVDDDAHLEDGVDDTRSRVARVHFQPSLILTCQTDYLAAKDQKGTGFGSSGVSVPGRPFAHRRRPELSGAAVVPRITSRVGSSICRGSCSPRCRSSRSRRAAASPCSRTGCATVVRATTDAMS